MADPSSTALTQRMILRCELTDTRHRELEDEMAKAKTDLDHLDEEMERLREEHKAKRKNLEKQLKAAATISHQGFEMLPVPVQKMIDLPRNRIVIERLDFPEGRKERIVADRALEKAERDEHLAQRSQEKRKEAP